LLVLCLTLSLAAQQPLPAPAEIFGAPGHHHSAAPHEPHTPPVLFDATALGSPMPLDRNWRVGITANPAAASPDFDDSQWAVRNAESSFAEVPDEDRPEIPAGSKKNPFQKLPRGHKRPLVWYRLHIQLAPDHGPLALLIELPVTPNSTLNISQTESVEVYANGKLLQPEGPHGENPSLYQSISRVYQIDLAPGQTDLTLAISNLYMPMGMGAYTNFFAQRSILLGNRTDLEHRLELWHTHSLHERLPNVLNSIFQVLIGIFLLVLFFTQKGHIEYLWLALHQLAQAPVGFIELAGSTAQLDHLWYLAMHFQLVSIAAYLYLEFLIAFLSLRRRWYLQVLRYSAPIMAGIAPSILLVSHGSAFHVLQILVVLGSLIWLLTWLGFVLLRLIVSTFKGNMEAGLLLFPWLLTLVGWGEPILRSGMEIWTGYAYHSPLTINAGPIPIHFSSIANYASLLAIVIIVFVRFLRVQRDQERVSNELEAARNVQELLIPQEKLHTPGFEVDSVYTPANEVGGDFFYTRVTPDGGLVLVVGDVAGKGLKAAMNVSMLMGALRSTAQHQPALILERLNRALTGSESFTTCQAAWFGPDGELVIANAGHLPPYLNSQEVAIPGSLPLGVSPLVQYEEIHLFLHPGDRLLLHSDGVVEARRPDGELFGFDRLHNLSNMSAFSIADAARSFGQEDDITVVTVKRLEPAPAS
jgi:uncharacterized membrane protein (Fun14 family)